MSVLAIDCFPLTGLVRKTPIAQCQAHAANRTSQPKPKFAARACHFPRTNDSDKNKKQKNPFPSVKI